MLGSACILSLVTRTGPQDRPGMSPGREPVGCVVVVNAFAELQGKVYPGGISAEQYLRIADAWGATVSAIGEGEKVDAAHDLLKAAALAGWTRSFLEEWIGWRFSDVDGARTAVLAELERRSKGKRSNRPEKRPTPLRVVAS